VHNDSLTPNEQCRFFAGTATDFYRIEYASRRQQQQQQRCKRVEDKRYIGPSQHELRSIPMPSPARNNFFLFVDFQTEPYNKPASMDGTDTPGTMIRSEQAVCFSVIDRFNRSKVIGSVKIADGDGAADQDDRRQ